MLTHTAHAVRRHKTLLLNTCLFFDFEQTMGFYWSYMLLLCSYALLQVLLPLIVLPIKNVGVAITLCIRS